MPEKINAKYHAIVGNNDITFDGAASSFRILGSAASPQNLLTIENGQGSGVILALREVSVVMDATAALVAVASSVRLHRTTALPTGGTQLGKVSSDTQQTSAALVIARAANSSDGGAATAITATAAAGAVSTRIVTRLHTLVGQINADRIDLLEREDQPLIIRAGEAILVQLTNATPANNPATNHYVVNCRWEEFTPR